MYNMPEEDICRKQLQDTDTGLIIRIQINAEEQVRRNTPLYSNLVTFSNP